MKLKIAIVGSRGLDVDIYNYIPPEIFGTVISGGADGVDTWARYFAEDNGIELIEFLPDYKKYGRNAPLVRNKQIVDACDLVVAFWDGKSRGTMHTVNYARKIGKAVKVYNLGY